MGPILGDQSWYKSMGSFFEEFPLKTVHCLVGNIMTPVIYIFTFSENYSNNM